MNDRKTLKWLYSGAKPQLPLILLLTVMRSSITVLGVIFALTSRSVIDAAVAGNWNALINSAIRLLLIIVCQIAVRFMGQSIEVKSTAKLQILFRKRLFESILKKDYSSITAYHSGDLMTRLTNDINVITSSIMALVPGIIGLLTGLLYALYTLIALDRNFAFIFLFGGLILLLIISCFRKITKKLHKRVQETEAATRSFFQESIGSVLMIKVFGIEKNISDTGSELQNENFKAAMKRRNLSVFASNSLSFIFSCGSFYALVWSAFRLYSKSISFGTLTAILQLVNQIQHPFANLSHVIPQYYSLLASAERVIEIESLNDEKEETPLEPISAYNGLEYIRFENISFNYGRDIILDNANLTINKGDFAVIAGISGIGKSTLIKLLLGVIHPTEGRIFLKIGGKELETGKYARPLFSYVPQGNLLLSGTIREAVSLVKPDATDDDIMKAAEISCAADFIRELPEGLDTYVGEKGMGLSEGQVQRLAVTRAILSDAPIILLDEATSALDEPTEEKLLQNIRSMNNKTCVIISHKRAAFNICNKEIYIENKKIREE